MNRALAPIAFYSNFDQTANDRASRHQRVKLATSAFRGSIARHIDV